MVTAPLAVDDGFGAPVPDMAGTALRWIIRLLAATTWISAAIFAIYILAFYLGAIPAGTPEDWNANLPRLYVPDRSVAANIGIGAHFALGAVLLLLGPVQFIAAIRDRWPRVHRWIGWTYTMSAAVTGFGGLTYIALRGTVGGPLMSVAFAIYGALMVVAAVQTVRHAVARRIEVHRGWAIRLFALAIGSWLYRMDYGFWFLFAGRLWHTRDFSGGFDYFMDFWFYVPNLIVAEAIIRGRRERASRAARAGATLAASGATAFLALATYFFAAQFWVPTVLWRLGLIAAQP